MNETKYYYFTYRAWKNKQHLFGDFYGDGINLSIPKLKDHVRSLWKDEHLERKDIMVNFQEITKETYEISLEDIK